MTGLYNDFLSNHNNNSNKKNFWTPQLRHLRRLYYIQRDIIIILPGDMTSLVFGGAPHHQLLRPMHVPGCKAITPSSQFSSYVRLLKFQEKIDICFNVLIRKWWRYFKSIIRLHLSGFSVEGNVGQYYLLIFESIYIISVAVNPFFPFTFFQKDLICFTF